MIYRGEKYLCIGYVAKSHGEKGKVLVRLRRKIHPEKFPPRIFIKIGGELEEYRVKLIKEFKNGLIFRLNKVKGREFAQKLVSSDIYIKEMDLPRRTKVELGFLPEFIPEADINPDELEEVGMIVRPRGLQGAVSALIFEEKMEKIKKWVDIFLEDDISRGKFLKSEVRAVKKISGFGDKVYVSLKLLYVSDRDSAEKLRRRKIFVKKSL